MDDTVVVAIIKDDNLFFLFDLIILASKSYYIYLMRILIGFFLLFSVVGMSQENFFDTKTKELLVKNKVKIRQQFSYHANNKKLLVSEIELSKQGDLIRYTQYAGGNAVHSIYWNYSFSIKTQKTETYGIDEQRRTITKYDSVGHVIFVKFFDEKGNWVSTSTNSYNLNGKIAESVSYYPAYPYNKTRYYYNNLDSLIRVTSEDSLGQITYDSNSPSTLDFGDAGLVRTAKISSPLKTQSHNDESKGVRTEVIRKGEVSDTILVSTIFHKDGDEYYREESETITNPKGLVIKKVFIENGAESYTIFEYVFYD